MHLRAFPQPESGRSHAPVLALSERCSATTGAQASHMLDVKKACSSTAADSWSRFVWQPRREAVQRLLLRWVGLALPIAFGQKLPRGGRPPPRVEVRSAPSSNTAHEDRDRAGRR